MVESGVFEVCPPQAPFSVERHANADSAVAAAAPQARRTSNACSIRKLILQQCKIVGCGRIGNLDRAPAVFTCRARGGERGPAARAWRRFGWTTASVSLTEGVHGAGDRRNLHSHSLQLEARWSGSAGHRRYRIPGTSRSRLPGAVADNLAATVYARSARRDTEPRSASRASAGLDDRQRESDAGSSSAEQSPKRALSRMSPSNFFDARCWSCTGRLR